jgi:rhodanese-related sulfurtransferase
MKIIFNKFLVVLLTIIFSSCIEDVVENVEVGYSNSADLITYVETRTDYFNGEDNLQLVTVDELMQNLGVYLVIDIRDEFDYRLGHVPGAINVQMEDLLIYLKEVNTITHQKIIFVSGAGQFASYVSGLLSIAGFENIYSLDGGMTYWNQVFSNELKNARDNGVRYRRYQKLILPKAYYNSPDVVYESNPVTIEEKIEERVQLLLSEAKFNAFISAEELDASYSIKLRGYINTFLIYTHPEKSLAILKLGEDRYINEFISAIFYGTAYGFFSNQSLLTLPLNRNIVMYSDNGQRSAYITAYLKLLGYSAKSVKYGKINMGFYTLRHIYGYDRYEGRHGFDYGVIGTDTTAAFDMEKLIRDYPYEVGE